MFGTIHAVLPGSSPAAQALTCVRNHIAEPDLAGRGLDTGPIHITLRYGIQGEDISTMLPLLAAHHPIAATLGSTSSFPPSAASPDVAVLYARITCPELHILNRRLGETMEFIETGYTYEPHVTIAYVKPQAAQKYVGNSITDGHTFVISEVVIRNQLKDETIVTLAG